ncbi:MAG: hypothetical protein IKF91_03710 [Bacilli bacterium]|nr:hypothetical protein [Bacilli bacterium]
MVYFLVFIFKIIEDALATLRLIVVSNGRKLLGSILQFICTIIWIVLTGSVLIDFLDDFGKVIAFSIGSFFGSYLGCLIEEKIALGTNSFIFKYNSNMNRLLNDYNHVFLSNDLIMIMAPRKRAIDVIKVVKECDKDALVISEKIKIF